MFFKPEVREFNVKQFMDLIESYLKIYPDKKEEFIFNDKSYRFFDSPVRILKREEKYVFTKGMVRQFGSIIEDEEKCEKLNVSIKGTNWLKTNNGIGEIYETNLYVKLISLALNKFVTLDPYGMGIEMEAGKPGWNDSMNGLPGVFGSGISETAELKRLVEFIIKISDKFDKDIFIPVEIGELLSNAVVLLEDYNKGEIKDFNYWDKSANNRESFRDKVRFGIIGKENKISTKDILISFRKFHEKITQ